MSGPAARNQVIAALSNIKNYTLINERRTNSDGVPIITVFVKCSGNEKMIGDMMETGEFEGYLPKSFQQQVHNAVSYLGYDNIIINEGYPYEPNEFSNGGFTFDIYIGEC